MTQRERQLLEWIRENPLISQQELADKAGITRSSAAVQGYKFSKTTIPQPFQIKVRPCAIILKMNKAEEIIFIITRAFS